MRKKGSEETRRKRSRSNDNGPYFAMEFITTISGGNYKWDLLLSVMFACGWLIFAADGYTAIEIDDLADIDGLLLQTRQMCRYGDRVYTRGTFQVAPCIWCECTPQGDTKCWAQTCPGDGGVGKWESGLAEPDPDPECIKYDRLDGECCPTCVEFGCKYNGTSYKRGSTIVTHDACRKCYCPWEGETRGEPECLELHCPPVNCVDPHKPPGKCCPVCPNGPNCWLKEHKLIIPAGRQVWVDKCHVCYCPTSRDQNNNQSSARKNNNVHVSLDAVVKQSKTTMSRMQPPSGLVDTQHAVCAYEKSYACDEET